MNVLTYSPHVRESGIRNPANFCCWNPESRGLESGIHNVLESGIHYGMESGIQKNPDFSYYLIQFYQSLPSVKALCTWLVFVLLLIIQTCRRLESWERVKRMRDARETIVFTVSTQMPACVITICMWTLQSTPVNRTRMFNNQMYIWRFCHFLVDTSAFCRIDLSEFLVPWCVSALE